MASKSGSFKYVSTQTVKVRERHPDSLEEQNIRFSASSGLVVPPEKDVPGRTSITGYVLTAFNEAGKAVWAESTGGGGGGGNPAGSVQGALQLRNSDGSDFEANDSLLWTQGTTTLSVPGTLSATTVSTVGGITATGTEITGVTRVGGLTNPPVNASDAASRAYVDSVAGQGVSWKNPVAYASTAADGNFALIGQTDGKTIDGVALSTFSNGQRFLLKDQTSGAENAIYEIVVPGTGGAGFVNFVLAPDIDGAKASGTAVFIENGATQADQGYVVTDVTGTDLFGSATSITWGQFTSSSITIGGTLDGEIQYNDGAGNLVASTDFMFFDGTQILQLGNVADTGSIRLGTNRLDITHNGTNGTMTNNLGTLTIDNDTRDVIISDVTLNQNSLTAGNILFRENAGAGTELITLKAPDGIAANFDITLPDVAGGDKQMLYSDASQNLSWNYPNQNYIIKNVIAGSNIGGGEHTTGTPYQIVSGDRFIYVAESGSTPVSNVAIDLPVANSIPGMIVTIGDKGGLLSNTTLGVIEIHVAGGSGNFIQGFGIGSVTQFNLSGADFVGVTLISDGDNLWHLVA